MGPRPPRFPRGRLMHERWSRGQVVDSHSESYGAALIVGMMQSKVSLPPERGITHNISYYNYIYMGCSEHGRFGQFWSVELAPYARQLALHPTDLLPRTGEPPEGADSDSEAASPIAMQVFRRRTELGDCKLSSVNYV